MDEFTVIVPEEDRLLVLVEEEFVIEVPGEWRYIEVMETRSSTSANVSAQVVLPPSDWVPANAKIHIDFVSNRAWTEVDGVVGIDTLLETNPDWGTFDPDMITADGFGNTEAVLAPSASDGFINDFSMVVAATNTDSGAWVEVLDLPDYNMEWTLRFSAITGITLEDYTTSVGDAGAVSGVHRTAVTFNSAKLAISVDGATTMSFDPSDNTPTHLAIHGGDNIFITSLTIYATVSDVELSALSEVT